jgi:ESCRT-I complex subunit TSG101
MSAPQMPGLQNELPAEVFDSDGPAGQSSPTPNGENMISPRYSTAPPLPPQHHEVTVNTATDRGLPISSHLTSFHLPVADQITPQYSSLPPRDFQNTDITRPRNQPSIPSPDWAPPVVRQPEVTKPKPPPDLLDEPLALTIPSPSTAQPPPIPPNPEKDALLQQLAISLHSLRQQARKKNESSMAGLQAQRTAMLGAFSTLQSEMDTLGQLSSLLNSNTAILHEALRKADSVIEDSRCHPAPDIDELLVAPTVVANQLYTLVAEERALGDAIFVLSRAVERGRISPSVFAKLTRSLAREWFLKKALVRKVGHGMGLAV